MLPYLHNRIRAHMAWLLRHAVIFLLNLWHVGKRRALQKIFSLLNKLEFVDVSSILKQAKDKQPSLKGKVPDRADGWSVSDQKFFVISCFPRCFTTKPLSHGYAVPAPLSGALSLKLSLHQK
ncbi:MAG: hypothetical protein J6K64_02855 [Clostridia bacterium]|nr:hypothetical protein [Clostridia bacterium]